MHLPFDYSLAKSKNRCEYANFQIAGFLIDIIYFPRYNL